ncbi:PfkB family carbohydrate kinase [Synechococcus sp. 'PEA 65AY6A-5F PE A']|uniref:PfkB family carbohydrate kinase n=1 Tax=Synechococcus sp. 'PEA 65AY6A-5F PE A' TaxID=1504259 RepID=UPI0039C07FFC
MASLGVTSGLPLIVGEALFDCFPDKVVLGGAALNVAWNLKGLGSDPVLLSRVGQDEAAEQLLAALRRQGLRLEGLQRDPLHPTGQVRVTLDGEGIPTFAILPDQAYDYIQLDRAALQALRPSLIYRGSLAARREAAHRHFQETLPTLGCPVFLDLNLRDPWWRPGPVREMLRTCAWLKLNQEELEQVVQLESIPAGKVEEQGQALRARLNLRGLFLTLGAAGAFLFTGRGVYRGEPVPVPRLVDTVGAGDGFSAVAILGLLQGWPEAVLLQRAVEFAAAICGVAGGAPPDPAFYRPFRQAWGL